MGTHSSKVKGKQTRPKEKQKQAINKNQVKTLCKEDSWLRMTINYNKEDLR
jgi:hypothetical protein